MLQGRFSSLNLKKNNISNGTHLKVNINSRYTSWVSLILVFSYHTKARNFFNISLYTLNFKNFIIKIKIYYNKIIRVVFICVSNSGIYKKKIITFFKNYLTMFHKTFCIENIYSDVTICFINYWKINKNETENFINLLIWNGYRPLRLEMCLIEVVKFSLFRWK